MTDAAAHHDQLLLQLVRTVTDDAIVTYDADGRVTTWNEGAQRLNGYEVDEALGSHCSSFFAEPERSEGLPDRRLAIAAADGRFEDEGWRLRKDGSLYWATAAVTALRGPDGRLLGFGEVARDVTDRKRGEDALRESEERLRLLIGSVADYAIFLLDTEGIVASWNLGAERLKGYRAEEIIGTHMSRFYTDEDRRAGLPQHGLRAALEEGRWETEGWRIRRDGSRFWANVVITALRGADGRHRGFAKVTRDLTERKRNEDALRGVLERERETAARLRDLDRARSDLVTIVAHDLRAPITVVQDFVQVLCSEWTTLSDAERLGLIERVAARAGDVSALVEDVFDLARLEAGQLKLDLAPTDLGPLVAELAADSAVSSRRGITTDIAPCPPALADPRRARQVLVNLISNAVKFSPPGSVVHLATGTNADRVVVSVTDQGPGIPAALQDAVFDRFTRLPTDGKVAGTGLGLYIARSLAHAQGGEVSIESGPGKGSTFHFSVPVATR